MWSEHTCIGIIRGFLTNFLPNRKQKKQISLQLKSDSNQVLVIINLGTKH